MLPRAADAPARGVTAPTDVSVVNIVREAAGLRVDTRTECGKIAQEEEGWKGGRKEGREEREEREGGGDKSTRVLN